MVGTAMKTLMSLSAEVRSFHTASALNSGIMVTSAPTERGQSRALTMPWVWCRGRTWRMLS